MLILEHTIDTFLLTHTHANVFALKTCEKLTGMNFC